MTFKQLEAFYWAAILNSFSGAAVRLHVTQSTLSKRVAELETDLGISLFDRNGHRAILTDAGHNLVERAAQILEIEGQIRSELDQGTNVRGSCRIGISELVASTWFPIFVECATHAFPNLVLEPQVDLTSGLERKLERGELDFAIIPGPSISPLLANVKIVELDYQWMASPSRLRKGTLLTPSQFAEHPVISLNPASRLSRTFDEWVRHQELDIPRALVCNSLTALIALAISGVGISYFPRVALQHFVRAGKLVELRSKAKLPTLAYCFHWRRDDHRRVITAMRKIVLDVVDFARSPLWSNE